MSHDGNPPPSAPRASGDAIDVTLREEPRPADGPRIREIVESTRFFHPYEVEIAQELIEERLKQGVKSGYFFVFADRGERTVGYSCYGPTPCTAWSYDIYWMAVDQLDRGGGLGHSLLALTEQRIHEMGGRRIYIETSSSEKYVPTRTFYERTGYQVDAVLKDFYGPDDAKVIYVKVLPPL